jgi:mono/diheme cytochrome c family protein
MRTTTSLLALACALGFAGVAGAAPPEKWGKLCATCHGDDGKGKTKMGEKLKIGDMTTADWQASKKDADMKRYVRDGNPKVKKPGQTIDKLSDAELDEMVKFVRSLKAK